MAIRTLVAAAAIVAFTTPAFAQNDEAITLLDDTVATQTIPFPLLLGVGATVVTVTVVKVISDANGPVNTVIGTFPTS
ncbi:MAG: hypothetical protein KC448_05190 [Yoonia sp.]|nr:hypothetical protein [Yoonia sp.]